MKLTVKIEVQKVNNVWTKIGDDRSLILEAENANEVSIVDKNGDRYTVRRQDL